MDEGKNRMYRWNFANPVRFQKSLRVQIRDQRGSMGPIGQLPSKDDFTSVVFWHQEGAHSAPAVLPYAARLPRAGRHLLEIQMGQRLRGKVI
jgi:Protein of unknown function (DUF2961)